LEGKFKYRYSRILSSKVNQFTSNQDRNDPWPILRIVEHISSAKMRRFVIICNYPREPLVAVARGRVSIFFLSKHRVIYKARLKVAYSHL